jgi:phosphotransferase system enzyme I (PtsP)
VVQRQRVTVERMFSDDPVLEGQRARGALAAMHGQLDEVLERPEFSGTSEHRDVLETFRMFAEDRGWLRRIDEAVQSGLSAEAAVQRVQEETRVRMGRVTEPYLRERLLDFEELTDRLLRQLVDGGQTDGMVMPADAVLVARTLGSAELLNHEPGNLKAVILEKGSTNAHATIVARALGVLLVGRLEGMLSRIETGDAVLVDGDNGVIYLRPGDEVRANFEMAVAAQSARLEEYQSLRDKASETRDGVPVSLLLNAGLLADMVRLDETGAEGIGLYRTEIPFMMRSAYPDVAA